MLSEEMRYQVMRLLETNPELSQRDVARTLGISLGRVNYCLQALIRKGWIKATNFKNSHFWSSKCASTKSCGSRSRKYAAKPNGAARRNERARQARGCSALGPRRC
jgi:DNA-binding Lrp family transcriptional regulator